MALCRVGMRKGRFGFGDETAMAFDSFFFCFSIITTVLICFAFSFCQFKHRISDMRHECLGAGDI